MNSTSKTTKSIALAAGLATIAAISLYFILRRSSKKKVSHIAIKKPLTEKEKNDIIRQIKITYNGQFLSVDSIIAIAAASEKISSVECDNLLITHKKCKVRRGYKDNLVLYVKECEAYINNWTQVKMREDEKVFAGVGISEETFEEAFNYYESQREPKILDFQNTLKKAVPQESNTEILRIDKLKTILIRMTELLEAERVNVPNVKRLLNNPRHAAEVISSRVSDIIYEEFGIEQQDFNRAFTGHYELLATHRPELIQRYAKATTNIHYG